jgi:hypothetical protein
MRKRRPRHPLLIVAVIWGAAIGMSIGAWLRPL